VITNSAPGFQTGMATLLLLLMSGPVFGQTHDPEALAAARAELQAERQEILRQELRLTESESLSFWPIYDNYRRDMMQVRDRQVEMITGYLQAYDSGELRDSYADKLLKDYFTIENDVLKVKKKYLPKFRKNLSALHVARFYQIENKIDAEIDVNLADMIPLVDPD